MDNLVGRVVRLGEKSFLQNKLGRINMVPDTVQRRYTGNYYRISFPRLGCENNYSWFLESEFELLSEEEEALVILGGLL